MTSNWIIDVKQEDFFEGFGEELVGFIYTVQANPAEYLRYVYVNTMPAESLNLAETVFYNENYGDVLNIAVYDKCAEAFRITVQVQVVVIDGGEEIVKLLGSIDRQYTPNILDGYEPGMERSNKMINSNVSYQLLRTNPKLTGNVKVVVTEQSNLYLDTFKVSLALGQYKYRHIPVNANEYYGRSLMHFRKMSTDDFYKVEDNCFNLFTAVNDYKSQYYTVYNSGVRTNEDHLYTENFAMLAPLCVKEVIPDFFLVFKVDTDKLSKSKTANEADKIRYFFENGILVKSFDFREGTNLGKYVRNIRENAKNYPGDIFASYDIRNYNKFIGISVDRGVVTSAYESMYKEKAVNNQVALNDYFTLGFERNKLVSKDIVNFEFMFNDKEENLFSINTYFGVYVTLNGESDTFSCIGYDGVYVFDKEDLHNIPAGSEILENEYKSLVYGVSTPDEFIRMRESIYDSSLMENFKLRPYRSVITGEYRDLSEDTEYEYISVTLNKDITEGDHFRIIDLKNAVIYDVIATGYTKYLKDGISEVTNNYVWYRRMRFTIKSVSAHFTGSLGEQAKLLTLAFTKLKVSKTALKQSQNSFSVKTYNTNCLFEKVSSVSDYTVKNKETLLGYTEDNDCITFFGHMRPEKLVVEASDVHSPDNDYFYLYPYYTEATGYRLAFVGDFQKISTGHFNHAVVSEDITKLNNKTIVYRHSDNTPELYRSFSINCYGYEDGITEYPQSVNYLLSPDLESWIVDVSDPEIYNSTLSLYTVYPINSGLCSILPLRDFCFDVLDSDTVINYFDQRTTIGDGGEFLREYMKYDSPLVTKTEEYVTDYFDKYRKYDGSLYSLDGNNMPFYNKLIEYTDKDAYYSYLLKENHLYSDISLTSPYVCKWRGIGTDARGESMRIMYSYDTSVLANALSYYIPYDAYDITYNEKASNRIDAEGKFDDQLGYLETADGEPKFIKYLPDFSNTMLSADTNEIGMSIKDAIMSGRISVDDILYKDSVHRNKFSTVYKAGENTLEFISGGVKIKIRSANDDVLNFNTYGGFQAVLISVPGSPSEHNVSTELIIDEVNRQMVLLWYTGTNSTEAELIRPSNVFKIQHSSPLYESKCVYLDGREGRCYLQTPNDTGLTEGLCESEGLLVLTNRHVYNNAEYSQVEDVMLVSTISSDVDLLYTDASYLTTLNPVIIVNGQSQPATNALISLYTDLYHDGIDMYVISDSADYDVNTMPNKARLKEDLKACGIYVRKHEGIMDYTNLDSFLTFTVVPPFKVEKDETVKQVADYVNIENTIKKTYGYAQTTYGTPVMTDMLEFKYGNPELNGMFNRVLDGMNIEVSDMKLLPQMWINKCTTSSNYCIPVDSSYPRISVDCLNNQSIVDNCWTDVYRDYDVHDFLESDEYDSLEWSVPVSGYKTGYEKGCFLGSRGIVFDGLEGDSIDLTIWKNTKVTEKDKCIKLDISESLVYKILFTKGYSDSWRYLGLRSNTYKIKYIRNTILPLLNITSNTVFTLYKLEGTKKLMFKDLTSFDDIVEVKNVRNELRYENGKYYMYVYPDEMHTYYAKMHIEL